jgi:hypothetical protein
MTTKFKITITSDSGKFVQEHIVSRKVADTMSSYINNNGTFNDVKTVTVEQNV